MAAGSWLPNGSRTGYRQNAGEVGQYGCRRENILTAPHQDARYNRSRISARCASRSLCPSFNLIIETMSVYHTRDQRCVVMSNPRRLRFRRLFSTLAQYLRLFRVISRRKRDEKQKSRLIRRDLPDRERRARNPHWLRSALAKNRVWAGGRGTSDHRIMSHQTQICLAC